MSNLSGIPRHAVQTVDALFAEQYGVIGRAQALACGMTPRLIQAGLESGLWERVHEAVYRLTGAAGFLQQSLTPLRPATGAARHGAPQSGDGPGSADLRGDGRSARDGLDEFCDELELALTAERVS